tara:strand:+ start:11892 stop:13184 length:1293 start_codon:yes stop_codon:yes gene_type:complete
MALIVQKFGGTSVASVECIKTVASKISNTVQSGNKVVVVVSAMAGETDKLLRLSREITDNPHPRELDVLLASGEQVSIALLALELIKRNHKAKSYVGSQIGVLTNKVHNKARIIDIDVTKINKDLADDNIVIVAGFQGVDVDGNITTLGRGGSDTTAVALAVALKADECQVFTDVDGVYTTDPSIVSDARKLDRISFSEMLEMASLGAKILQTRAVELAGKHRVPLRVVSTFGQGDGTLISYDQNNEIESQAITGIAVNISEVKVKITSADDTSLIGLDKKNNTNVLTDLVDALTKEHIDFDMFSYRKVGNDNLLDIEFTINSFDSGRAHEVISQYAEAVCAKKVLFLDDFAKVSVVGLGIGSNSELLNKIFSVLKSNKIEADMLLSAETKVSFLIDEKYVKQVVCDLHDIFHLAKDDSFRYMSDTNSTG